MKKYYLFLVCGTLLSTTLFAQFTGAGSPNKSYMKDAQGSTTIKEVLANVWELDKGDIPISLTGNIISQEKKEAYTFRDTTGTITIEIDNDIWGRGSQAVKVDETMEITIHGEVDSEWYGVKIEVDSITLSDGTILREYDD